jgi:hypothetical protein
MVVAMIISAENPSYPIIHCSLSQNLIYIYAHKVSIIILYIKVKVTLAQALRLCTGRTAHRGSRGMALFFHDHGTRRGWGVSVTNRPLFTPVKDPVSIVQETGWAPGPVWTGAENLASTGIRSPDRPARSQSLYRLRYLAHKLYINMDKMDAKWAVLYLDPGVEVRSDVPAGLNNGQSDNSIYRHQMKNLLVCHFHVASAWSGAPEGLST